MPERVGVARWSARLGAVPVAGFRSSLRHVESTVGSRTRLLTLLAVIAALAIAANVAAFGFYDSILGDLFNAHGPFDENQRARLTAIFVSSSCVVSSAIALLVAMIVPPHSRIALSARIAGASRSLIAVGEFVPTVGLIVVVVITTSGASAAVVASYQALPACTFLALASVASAFGVLALVVRDAVVIGAGLLKWSDTAARSVGMLVAMLVTGGLIVDIGAGALQQRSSVVAQCLVWLWSGQSAPTTLGDAAASLAVLLALLAVGCVTAAGGGLRQPLQVGWRLLAARPVGKPSGFINFVIREVLLYLRHPVTAVSLISMAVLIGAGVAATRAGLVPAQAIVILFAILCAAGAETAHGRTRRVKWIFVGARQPAWVRVAAQLVALAGIQFLLLVAAVFAAVPIEDVLDAVLSVAPVFVALFVLSYLAGVLVPFSEDAPFGAALTTAVVLMAEIGWLAAESFVAQNAHDLVPFARALIIVIALALALRLAARDLRTL